VGISTLFRRFERWLAGWPDSILTIALLAAAAVLVVVALAGRPLEKVVVASWVFFP
jgi:hypothetical protein